MKDHKGRDIPNCPKCGGDNFSVLMEAVVVPGTPTMYLTKYTCETCKAKK